MIAKEICKRPLAIYLIYVFHNCPQRHTSDVKMKGINFNTHVWRRIIYNRVIAWPPQPSLKTTAHFSSSVDKMPHSSDPHGLPHLSFLLTFKTMRKCSCKCVLNTALQTRNSFPNKSFEQYNLLQFISQQKVITDWVVVVIMSPDHRDPQNQLKSCIIHVRPKKVS